MQFNNETTSSKPELKTIKDLKRHVSEIYIYANFYKVQNELWVACMGCEVDYRQVIEEGHVITIADNNQSWCVGRQLV